MGDSNGRLDSPMSGQLTDSISPPSLKDPQKCDRSDIYRDADSPLLDTELLPNDDHSTCPYCHRGFRKPRVLDCLHSMCEDCIIAQLDGRRDAQKAQEVTSKDPTDFELEAPRVRERPTPPGVIRCPICAQESHVGNDVRYVHTMLLDYVRYNDNDEPRPAPLVEQRRCRACKSEQSAVAFCKQCQSDLCSNCLTAHGLMRLFDGHEAVPYPDVDLMSAASRADVRAVVCPHHHQPYKVLCATCEHLACKICLEMEHLQHKVIEVSDRVVNAIEAEVRGLVTNLDTQWRNSLAEWSSIPDRHATLHEQYETAKARLELHFEQLQQSLEDVKQRKLKELDAGRVKQEHAIEDLYRKMNVNESRVNDALSFTRRLLDKANGMELLVSRRKVVQQLNNLNHTMPALGIQVELEYQPVPRKQAEQQLAVMAGIVSARMCSSLKDTPISMDQMRTPMDLSISSSSGGANSLISPAVTTIAGTGGGTSSSSIVGGVGPMPLGAMQFGDWPSRLNGSAASAPNLAAIGAERKKIGPGGLGGFRASTDTFNGWPPPSSNPPDLPSVSPPPGVVKEMMLPGAQMSVAGSLATQTPLQSATSMYSNYAWPPSSNPPLPQTAAPTSIPSAAAMLHARQQLAMAALLQQQQQAGGNTAAAAASALLMQQQARIRAAQALQQQADPLLASLSSLGIGGGGSVFDTRLGGGGTRTSPQDRLDGRLSELKVHSVFGTSQSGSSIRELHCPSGFCLSENDDILIADTNNHRVTVCGPPAPWKIGKPGTEDGMLCFPRKVVALKGDHTRYIVLDKGADGKTRAQVFSTRGDFETKINLAPIVPRGGIEVAAATGTSTGYLILVDSMQTVYCIDVDTQRIVTWFDASAQLGEASDIAVDEKYVYITDFKHHCVQMYTLAGEFVRKLGEPSQTPYPIGIEISKTGDILVADTHGNHLHVVVFSSDGNLVQSFTHNEFRLSRCVGLRVAGSGHIVTLCKHNHTLFVFKPLRIR